jgi:3-oxoacyl-[acyl-carrier protein] reductase
MSAANGSALVTGASRGIGAAIAKALAADGWAVGVNYAASKDAAEQVVSEIEQAGGRAVALPGDVADPASPDALFAALEEAFGAPVLTLVNNAGITRDDLTPTLGDEEWNAVIETNLSAAFRFTRRALKPMMRARQGRIVNISSAVALRANPGQSNYSAAKAGLIALTKTTAVEVARRGITVNAVAPGFIETRLTAAMPFAIREAARRLAALAQGGLPDDVAHAIVFLASPGAHGITGAALRVCGGAFVGA